MNNFAKYSDIYSLMTAISEKFKSIPLWIGTEEEHTTAITNGEIPSTALVLITDPDENNGSGNGGSGGSGGGSGNGSGSGSGSGGSGNGGSGNSGSGGAVTIVPFSTGTDTEIANMLEAARNGNLDLSQYWHVGDTRTVHHSAIEATNGLEAQDEQDAVWVIMDTGANSGYTFADGTPVNFVIGMQDSLNARGVLATSDKGPNPWKDTARYSWLNTTFRQSLPEGFRSLFQPFIVNEAANYNSAEVVSTEDYFSLFSEKEIAGTAQYASAAEANATSQIEYYKTAENRIKDRGGSPDRYWTRTILNGNYDTMVRIEENGIVGTAVATNGFGISPFGCI